MTNPISPDTSSRARLVTLVLTLGLIAAACGSTTATSSDTPDTPIEDAIEAEASEQDAAEDEPAAEATQEDAAEASAADSGDETAVATVGTDVNLDSFVDGAIVSDVVTADCTLSGGTETECYTFTVTGFPISYETGPFCPTTTDATADEVGLWLDGENLYNIDGEFILSLAEIYNDDFWMLHNDDGTVNVTETQEEFELAAVPEVDDSLLNHCVEGRVEWLDGGVPVTSEITIPVTPIFAGTATTGGNWGVTLDGVTIAAGAPVEAILGNYTIAAFDPCGGHYNPFEGYHVHAATGCSEVDVLVDGETPMFAIAMDGFAIHSPVSDDFDGELDDCGGHETEELGYHYHANPAEDNGVLSCFTGETASSGDARGGGGGGGGGRPEGPPEGR